MHHKNHFLGLFELNSPCMNVKFVTLRVISTLGGQIYVLDALSPTKIDCMHFDFRELDESFLGLGKLGRGPLNLFCY